MTAAFVLVFFFCLLEIPVFGISSPAAHQLTGFVFSPCACGAFLLSSNLRVFFLLPVGTCCMPWGFFSPLGTVGCTNSKADSACGIV